MAPSRLTSSLEREHRQLAKVNGGGGGAGGGGGEEGAGGGGELGSGEGGEGGDGELRGTTTAVLIAITLKPKRSVSVSGV